MAMNKTFYNKETKIWHGPQAEPKCGPQDSVGSMVFNGLRKFPDNIAQICYQSGREFTNTEMCRLSVQAARHFEKLQLQQCDMVGMCVANSDYVAPIFYGAMFTGLTVSTTDPSFNRNGLKHVYSLSRPKVMFCDGNNYHTVRQAFDEIGLSATKIYTVRQHIEGVSNILEIFEGGDDKVEEFMVPQLKNGSDQVAIINCTSGSTGLPKGVCVSHASLLEAAIRPVASDHRRVLCFSSLYWFLGVVTLVHGATDLVTRIISESPFSPEDFFDIVKRYKINELRMSPSHIPLCLASPKLAESDLSSLRLCLITGKTVPYSVIEKFRIYAPNCIFLTAYGMTELSGAVTVTIMEPTNSVGQLKPNTEVKILDNNGTNLGPNEVGEICMRIMFKWAGYLNNPEATKARYDADRWFHSGDMGYFNENGQLYVVDRRVDILKYNNFHFSPTNIENVIYEMPDVAEVCVVGIPDTIYDFLPAAAVVKRPGSKIQESDIKQYVADRMQHFENLHGGVYFVDSMPLTASGKTIRNEVTELCKTRRKELIEEDSKL